MDFFTHQEAARRRTSLLLFYYALAVVLLIAGVYAATMLVFNWRQEFDPRPLDRFWNLPVFLGCSVATLALISLGALWRMVELRQGGRAVAEMLGGRLLPLEPSDPAERRLRNVVEEMAIASGTPVPEIYVLDAERGINAFAAGHSTADVAVGVTRGCIQHLSREELQGVIAHEFSHILNGDMRLNLRLIGVLHGILCIYIVGRVLLRIRARSSGSSRKGGNPLPLFGLLLVLIGSAGVFFGRLIQAAVSRQREFLADAAAVQFTRNPDTISGALKKIGAVAHGSRLRAAQAAAASHLYFGNGLGESWFGLMATHPPLDERIRRIDPAFDGKFPALSPDEGTAERAWTRAAVPGAPMSAKTHAQLAAAPPLRPAAVVARIGQTAPLRFAAGVLESLPGTLHGATHDGWSATALMFALVLSHMPETRAQQIEQLRAVDPRIADESLRLRDELEQHDERARLPLLSLSLPALRTLSREQWQCYRAALEQLVSCDARIDLFEFVLKKLIERHVDARWAAKKTVVIQYYSFTPLATDCALLVSALAHCGATDPDQVYASFQRGASRLPMPAALPLVPWSQCGIEALDGALTRLAQAVPHIKKTVIEACAEAVAADGLINAHEAELLRAIADTLDCPTPPFVEGI